MLPENPSVNSGLEGRLLGDVLNVVTCPGDESVFLFFYKAEASAVHVMTPTNNWVQT